MRLEKKEVKRISVAIVLAFITAVMCLAITENGSAAQKIDWDNNVIEVSGTGVIPEYATSPGQGQALARRAAIVDAYRNLASVIYGVQVDSDTTVEQLAVKNDTIKTNVSGLIKNARITDERAESNGNYSVTMAVRVFGERSSLAAAIYSNKAPAIPTAIPYVSQSTATSTDNKVIPVSQATGVVVDCRGLNLDRVMSPVIRDTSGRAVYGTQHVESDWVIKHGMASYVHDETPGDLTRAGSNPIIVKAVSLDNHNWDPVISKEDADKILSANQANGFLQKCPVVFIQ